MTHATLAETLTNVLTYSIGSGLMYYIMRRKVQAVLLRYEEMKTAFQAKHLENQQMWLKQQQMQKVILSLRMRLKTASNP